MNPIKYLLKEYKYYKSPVILEWTRLDLPTVFNECGYTVGAEIGVEKGHFSEAILRENPQLTLHCVDPLIPYKDYREHVTKEEMDGFYEEVKRRLSPYKYVFHRDFSMNVVDKFEDESLDFVYIDGNHDFVNTVNDIARWSQKVKKGGIVAGHDYTNFIKTSNRCDVRSVVNAWTEAYKIKTWFVTTEKSPSWFWIKS